jgi:hypothetical protein
LNALRVDSVTSSWRVWIRRLNIETFAALNISLNWTAQKMKFNFGWYLSKEGHLNWIASKNKTS